MPVGHTKHNIGSAVMNVFIANFGRENLFWPLCRNRSVVATYFDEDLLPYWQSGDRDGYVAHCIASKRTARNIAPTRSIASRWFNLPGIVSDTEHDLWLHREKNELWWTMSVAGEAILSHEAAPWQAPESSQVCLIQKPSDRWTNMNKRGASLSWAGLHPKAREFLFTEGTLQKLTPDNAQYARNLVDGLALTPWHARAEWNQRSNVSGHGAVTTLNAKEKAIARMVQTVEDTVKASQGGPVLQNPKRKERRFATVHELHQYIAALVEDQEGLCALTELPLQFDGQHNDEELLCSLDRIDSTGHYEAGNLQVVCRFVNRWKRDDEEQLFRRLMNLVRGTTT